MDKTTPRVPERARAGKASAERISRRDAIRRTAIVGGTLAWAGPAIQRFAAGPAFAVGTPPPPPPPPPPPTTFHAISYVGFVFTCNGTTWRAKWENDKGFVNVVSTGASKWQALPHCSPPSGWDEATGLPSPGFDTVPEGNVTASPNHDNGELVSICFTVPAGCTLSNGAGVAMGAGGDSTDQGFCLVGTVNGQTICFTAPAT